MPVDKFPRMFKVPIVLPFVVSIIGVYLILVPFMKVSNPTTVVPNEPETSFQGYDLNIAL